MTNSSNRYATTEWAVEYYLQQTLKRKKREWRVLLRPSVIGACLAIAGRIIIGPIALVLLFFGTGYLTHGTVLIKADSSIFAFTEYDPSMIGGCSGCVGPCKIGLLKYSKLATEEAITTSTMFNAFAALGATESLYDFSSLSAEALALAESLDDQGAFCQTGISEWGSIHSVLTGTAQQVLDVVNVLNLNLAPQMRRELELAIEHADECITTWNLLAIGRLFQYPITKGSAEFGKISAADINIFPDYTECRPVVTLDDSLVGSKLASATDGDELLSVVPEILTLFPYSFTSIIPAVSRQVPASNTKYPATTIVQPLLRAYYGGCRVRAVNSTGIFVESTCRVSAHWESYGLMIHSPDDVPLCSTGDICIHNYYNSLWEWVNSRTADRPDRVGMNLNTSRSRYADTVPINVLPGIAVMQILLMGLISLYQVMSQKRSVLLTQIWAYRCQNGRMQVVYLAQITYHLIYNSDLYMIGLGTGTLTTESLANLTCCFFAFSYSFINLVKARSGDQVLDRHFRLTWEAMQIISTVAVGAVLRVLQRTPIQMILTKNGEVLRKATARGAKYCGLHDSCVLFTVNLAIGIAVISLILGVVALIISYIFKKSSRAKVIVRSVRLSMAGMYDLNNKRLSRDVASSAKIAAADFASTTRNPNQGKETSLDKLTSFEENCIGAPFNRMFQDCDDMAYVMYNGKRCTTVEALLLTGYLYHGEHIYQASSVMLLLAARVIPRKMLRTFNMLLLRWHVHPSNGTISHPLSCTWYTASAENHKLAGAVPIA